MLELFHAAPSYYSMVARLALAEAQLPYASRLLDIHLAKQQLSPAYRRLNGAMTVPTLRGPDLLLTDSAEILAFAAAQAGARWADADPAVKSDIQAAVAGHYAISIETLTFSKLLTHSPWTRPLVRTQLAGLVRHLEQQADAERDGGGRLEVDERLHAHAAEDAQVAAARDARHERGEDQRRDDHLDQTQEDLTEHLDAGRDRRIELVDQDAGDDAEEEAQEDLLGP
mgnify:CR=1 FL=1